VPACALRRPPQSAIFDFTSLLTVILLFICTCAFLRAATYKRASRRSFMDDYQHGFSGLFWKAARVGERLSPWVATACVVMAVHVLFIKA
jgi:hypothetical protein